jgi:hypothetical protein
VSSLVNHARRELELCGQTAEDPGYAASLVATVAAFASYGHSGPSAELAVEQLTRLLRRENLAPLTDDPLEWQDQSVISQAPLWQNIRNRAAISYDGGRTYYLVNEPKIDQGRRWHTSVHHVSPGTPHQDPVNPTTDPTAEGDPR